MEKSASEHHLLQMIQRFIPEMTEFSQKGQRGRVGIIGGCEEYAGGIFFAGIAALKVGSDLSHVFCTIAATPSIRAYSPELIVHPVLDTENVIDEMAAWLPRLQGLVIGPGLGFDPAVLETTKTIICKAREKDVPIIIDAQAIPLIAQCPDLIRGYRKCMMTPNAKEFACLFNSLISKDTVIEFPTQEQVEQLARVLDHITIVSKGRIDIITDGKTTVKCDTEGSNRRCWGQGDLLSGALCPLMHWALASDCVNSENTETPVYGPLILSGYAVCFLMRMCNKYAFEKEKRATTSSDMIPFIGRVFYEYFEVQ